VVQFRRLVPFAFALLGAFAAAAPGVRAQQAPPAAPAQTLYHRLGGYDGIAAVTDDFIHRLATDDKEKRFFVGFSDDSKARIRQLFVDQLCYLTGGPCVYIGRDMKTVHKGLHITEDDWKTAVDDLTASLNKFNVGQREQTEVFAALTKLKPDIVTGPAQ
jgi:hemoglobin